MKLNQTYLFIAIASIALVVVLIIQVNWLLQTARIKEELFNEKANMVLSRTVEALSSDKEICQKIEACLETESNPEVAAQLGKDEKRKIDSIFTHYMAFYNFHIDYYFEVKSGPFTTKNGLGLLNNFYLSPSNSYKKSFEELATENELELKLIFPEKKQFIRAELGPLFITSVILILVVLVMFWQTVLSLIKKKEILEHTTDFLNNMTHEFKTPLTNIALASKMLSKDAASKQDIKINQYTGIILEENEKLRLQVEQVLSMTALERGDIPVQKTLVDVHELLKGALNRMHLQMENTDGNVHVHLDADKFMIRGDYTHLTNSVCNLLDNAIKYSKAKPELSLQTINSGPHVLISLSDKGIGIKKEYQKKVFDKFFRVPTGDRHDVKGFGLGLAYIKKIVELHNGTIALESEKGKGTTFILALPYV